jgi:hypothetical protein
LKFLITYIYKLFFLIYACIVYQDINSSKLVYNRLDESWIAARLLTSHTRAKQRSPINAFAAFNFSAFLPAIIVVIPFAVKFWAMARPSPDPPP